MSEEEYLSCTFKCGRNFVGNYKNLIDCFNKCPPNPMKKPNIDITNSDKTSQRPDFNGVKNPPIKSDLKHIPGVIRLNNQMFFGTNDGLIVCDKNLQFPVFVFDNLPCKNASIKNIKLDFYGKNLLVNSDDGLFIITPENIISLGKFNGDINDMFMKDTFMIRGGDEIYYHDGQNWQLDTITNWENRSIQGNN